MCKGFSARPILSDISFLMQYVVKESSYTYDALRCVTYSALSLLPVSHSYNTQESQGVRGGTVVKVLCYKSEGRWFDPSWCHWNFSLISRYGPGVDSASNRNEYQEHFLGVKAVGDRLCGLVVKVSGYRYRGPGFDPRRYQIF